MQEQKKTKNMIVLNGVQTHKRWTVLNVESDVVEFLNSFAKENRVTVGRALSELTEKKRRQWKKQDQ